MTPKSALLLLATLVACGETAQSGTTVADTARAAGDGGDPACMTAPLCGPDLMPAADDTSGCGPCPKGEAHCAPHEGATAVFGCNSLGCYNVAPCAATSPCIEAGPAGVGCISGFGTCVGLQEALTFLTGKACGADADCHLLKGRCTTGLTGWNVAASTSVTQIMLDALFDRHEALKCAGYSCDAAPPPTAARCQGGVCASF